LEAFLKDKPQVDCPLDHIFTPGLYTRKIFMPAGTVIVSKIHKTEHPFHILKGKVLVKINEDEWEVLEAGHSGITIPGTRRVLYIEEDCIWITSHVLAKEGETLEEIEERIIEKHELELNSQQIKELCPNSVNAL
jgi:quercetin dioxygenase-like cupin family protein